MHRAHTELVAVMLGDLAQEGRRALARRQWERAWTVWRLVARFAPQIAPKQSDELRNILAGAVLERALALSQTGAERGIASGNQMALDLVVKAVALDPNIAVLHLRCVALGVRIALEHYGEGPREAFGAAVRQMWDSLVWFAQDPGARIPRDAAAPAMLAEGWVCASALCEHPQEAILWLECALAGMLFSGMWTATVIWMLLSPMTTAEIAFGATWSAPLPP